MNDAMTIALIKSYVKKYSNNTQNGTTLKSLRFTGAVNATYDGSKAVEVAIPADVTDEHINGLIDAKLGVIENGSY